MAKHKKPSKTRYRIGIIAGVALLMISGVMALNIKEDPAALPLAEVGRLESFDRSLDGPREIFEELSLMKSVGLDIEPTETPSPTQIPEPMPEVVGNLYTTEGINIRIGPSLNADKIGAASLGTKLDITGDEKDGWTQIIYDGKVAWVSSDFVSETKPEPPPLPYYEECPPTGSPAESGLTSDALHVLRCIEENFPEINDYGGVAQRSNVSDHPYGRAVDAMIPLWDSLTGNDLGWEIANWVRKRAACLGVTYIIFDARIWNVDRSEEGWRPYSHPSGGTDATTLHLDHVHVSVQGDAGTRCKD